MSKITRIITLTITILFVVAVFGYTISVMFKPGYIYHSDVTEGLALSHLWDKYLYTYNDNTGVSLAEKARIPLVAVIFSAFKLFNFVGFDDSYFVKIKLFCYLFFTFSFFTIFIYKFLLFLEEEYNNNPLNTRTSKIFVLTAALLGSLYYTFNYWATNRIVHFGLFFSTATIPIFFYFLYTYLFSENENVGKLLFLALFSAIFTATPHTVLFEILITTIIYLVFITDSKFGVNIKIKRTVKLLIFGILYLLINSYWILPFLMSSTNAPDAVLTTDIVNLLGKEATLQNSVRLIGYWLANQKAYFMWPMQEWLAYVPFALSIVVIISLIKSNARISKVLLLFLLTSIFLATNTHITNTFYYFVMFNSPLKSLGWLFREYDKFGIVISFVYSISISLVIYLQSKCSKVVPFIMALFVTLAICTSNLLFFKTDIKNRYTPVTPPKDLAEITNYIKSDTSEFNTAWYPSVMQPNWANNEEVRYIFSNLITKNPVTINSKNINYIEYLFNEENAYSINIGYALNMLGVKYLVIRNDINDTKNYKSWAAEKFEYQKEMEKVLETENYVVYKNNTFDGISSFHEKTITTNRGLSFLKTDTFKNYYGLVNFTDKPTALSTREEYIDLNPEFVIDYRINKYKDYFVYPYNYINVKDDGNAGAWKIGTLEDVTHAETEGFFKDLGIVNNQFDYDTGIAIARDGYTLKGDLAIDSNNEIPLNFDKANISKKDNIINFYATDAEITAPWKIVKSADYEVSGKRALFIQAQVSIDKTLETHMKVHFYNQEGKTVETTSLYPNTTGVVYNIVKVPSNAIYANTSIWQKPLKNFEYEVKNLKMADISNNVKGVEVNLGKHNIGCKNNCVIYARTFVSPIGGILGIKIGNSYMENTTRTEFTKDQRFNWIKMGNIENISDDDTFTLISVDGFNATNAVVSINQAEEQGLFEKTPEFSPTTDTNKEIKNEVGVIVEKENPTKYNIQIYGASENNGILELKKPFDKNWILIRKNEEKTSSLIEGYNNGWQLDNLQNETITIEYKPQKFFYKGVVVSEVTAGAIILYFLAKSVSTLFKRESKSQG